MIRIIFKHITGWAKLQYCFATLFICIVSSLDAQIPLEIDDGGYLFIKVKINDADSARFMLDTGGGINMLSEELFNKLKPSMTALGLHTGTRHNGESSTGMLYQLSSISVGNFKKQNVAVGEWDGLKNCDGILSMNYFENIPFTIDFKNKLLIIESSPGLNKIKSSASRISIVLKRNGKYELDFFVNICIDDSIPAKAEFDTGAGFNMLMLQPRYLDLLKIKIDTKNKTDYGYYVYSTKLPKLSYCAIPRLEQSDVFVGFKEGLIYDALVGSGMFSTKKLTIDLTNSEIFVSE